MTYQNLQEKLSSGSLLILDGGIGTEVFRRGVRWRQHGIEDAPDVIRQIHIDYLNAGADVITSHTFNLTKRNFINFFRDTEHMVEIGHGGLETRAEELCHQAIVLAKEALETTGKQGQVPIAGSISPIQHLFRPDLAPSSELCYEHHKECVSVLKDCSVDFIFFEAMNNIFELKAALQAGKESNLPLWVSLIPNHHGNLLGGESLVEAAKLARNGGVDVVFLSAAPLEVITQNLPTITNRGITGAKAMIGKYNPPSWKPDFYPRFEQTDQSTPEAYADFARRWKDTGATIIGGGSGTTPEHIATLKSTLI